MHFFSAVDGLVFVYLLSSAIVLAQNPHAYRHSEPLDHVKRSIDARDLYRSPWTGAVFYYVDDVDSIAGSFKVPMIHGPANSGAVIRLGIDNPSECDSTVFVGVQLFIGSNGKPYYIALAGWSPGLVEIIPNFTVAPGDVITIYITLASDTIGLFKIQNSNGQTAINEITSTNPLCRASTAWIITQSSYHVDQPELAPLVDFQIVTFTGSVTHGTAGDVTNIFSENDGVTNIIYQNDIAITSVQIDRNSVSVSFV